ncbi:MAG: hypothetical protein AAF213_12640, partial [Pseudomonadota bacterium]
DILPSNEVQDLTRREADISIRHARPEQPDLIAKLLFETSAHLYASEDYLQRFGPIEKIRKFGGRDHTTVMHAVRKIEEICATDSAFAEDVELLKRMLSG